MTLASQIAKELNVRPQQVEATIALLDEGSTVPFIARYRKEVTGALDDSQLRLLAQRVEYLRDLQSRKQTILQSIQEQGKLTPQLKADIESADTKVRLEDLYLPFKQKRRTKAQIAREAGLAPLATRLLQQSGEAPLTLAKAYINPDHAINHPQDALDGAQQILIEQFAEEANLLETLRQWFWQNGQLHASVMRGKASDDSKFRDYYDHTEAVSRMPSHRALAVFRGQKGSELKISILPPEQEQSTPVETIKRFFSLPNGHSAQDQWLASTAELTWSQKLHKQLETDALRRLRETAEAEAIRVFGLNLKDLLLAAPAGQKITLGLDPGLRTGVKATVVDQTGKLLAYTTVFAHAPRNQWDESIHSLATLIKQHAVDLISIGNGTASRETEQLVKAINKHYPELTFTSIVVSEAGASVYSASELAAKEFPELDVTYRGAVSIARRLQDPLAELVKIDPKAIGVGQYQHDVDQKALAGALDSIVEDCVNHVGVDLNTASCELLVQVAGLNRTTAQNIIDYRDANGAFSDRKKLLKVPRLGAKAFEQCAGFLRIRNGKQALDNSAVHPEAYDLVDQMAHSVNTTSDQLIGNTALLSQIDRQRFISDQFGEYTVRDVLSELEKPGRDPRPEFKTATFADGVEKIADLEPGMQLEGVVTNVTNFGAFVDIGVHQDGLVHISALSDQFVKDPHTLIKTGDIVSVRVIDVDEARKRIALSMKSNADSTSHNRKAAPKTSTLSERTYKKALASKNATQQRSQHLGTGLADSLKAAGFKIK